MINYIKRIPSFAAVFLSACIGYSQCDITPELTGVGVIELVGNNNDYIVVCTAGATTGALLVQNGIPANFLNAFNSYIISWGDNSPNFTTTQDAFSNPAATHLYSIGNYVLTFSAIRAGCTVTHSYDVYVGNTPSVSMGTPGGTEGCSEVNIAFPISNADNNIPSTTYTVTFSDLGVTQNFNQPPPASVSHSFNQSSCGETFNGLENSFGVTITADNECGQAQVSVAPVRISDPPDADFDSNIQTVCTSGTITFDDTSDPGTTATQTGCTSNARFYWSISPSTGWSVASGVMGSFNGLPNNFTVWTTGTDILTVNFNQPGTYEVTLNYMNGCGPSSHAETICVIEPPVCDFDVNNASGCGPLSVVTDNNTIAPECDGDDINLNYNWQITVPTGGSYTVTSGSLTSANPAFNFTNTTTNTLVYTITLTTTPVNPQTGAAMTTCASTCQQVITVYPAPIISTHPTPNQSICVGGTPSILNVAYMYGVGTPSYQWYSNTINSNSGGTIISGATNPSYQPPTLNVAGNYYYYAVISLGGSCGTIASNPACVSVVADPTINNQPLASQTICAGGVPTTLSMSYTNGTGTAGYQWYSNTSSATTGGTAIAGATSSSFTPSVPSTPGSYYFYGIVTLSGSGCGTATSASAQIQVIADPLVNIVTTTYTYCQNAAALPISANVTGGNGTNSYQWYQTTSATNTGGTAIAGQTGGTFTPPTTTVGTQYYYAQITQSTSGCSTPSPSVTINILPAASFNTQPQPSTVCVGGSPNALTATFVNGTGTLSYQWYSSPNSDGSGGTLISGATSASYTPSATAVGTVYYYVVITFSLGGCANIISNTAAVNVLADPTLSITPSTSQELCVGAAPMQPITATATGGTGTLSYQWYSNLSNSNSGGTIISGATTATYAPPSFSTAGTYYYYATVSATGSGCTTNPSAVASVVVVTDPIVTSQPLGTQQVCQNAPTTVLNATVSGGSGTPSFVWYSNSSNSNIGGVQVATTNTYTPPSTSVGTMYYYAVITQTGAGCSVTTATAQVIVTPAATINLQPIGSTVCAGGLAADLTITISNGLGTPNYQWFTSPNSNGAPSTAINGATNSSYTPPTTIVGNLYYFVIVTFLGGSCGSVTSNTAQVNVIADPSISVQPITPQTVCQGNALGAPISFTATGGTGAIAYQWYSNTTASNVGGILISGANTTNYAPPVFNIPGSYYYYAIVTAAGNGCEQATTTVAAVVVNAVATATVTGPYSTCGSTPVSITSTASGAGTWSASPNVGLFGTSSAAITTFTPNNGSSQVITLTWTTSDPDGNGPCASVSASTPLTVYPPATASINPTANLCSNATLQINCTTNAPGTWTTNGSGNLNPTNSAATTYTPNVGDVAVSPLLFTWTTNDPDGAGPCAAASAAQSVTVYAPPVVNAGLDQTLCLNSSAVTLPGSPASGTWTGNGVGSNGNFNPTTVGVFNLTYSYTDSNNCLSTDQVIINVNQSATADANGPYQTCGLNPISINATANGTGSWVGGVGTFANPTSTNTSYTPASTEVGTTITLTWNTLDPDNAGPCSGASDIAQLTINTPASAAAGGPYTICSNDVAAISVTATPSTGSWSGGTGSFASSSSANTSYDPGNLESGTAVALTWTTTDPDNLGPCPTVTVSVTVNVLEAATADAGGPYEICGAQPMDISAITNGTGAWTGGMGVFTNADNPSTIYTPSVTELGQQVELTWTTFDPDGAGPCNGASDIATLTISIPATAIPQGPYTICSDDVANIAVITTPGGGAWSGGMGTFGQASSSTTTYDPSDSEAPSIVEVLWTSVDPDSNGPCLAVTAEVIINVLEAAIADANGPYYVCGAEAISINATTNGTGTWSGGGGIIMDPQDPSTTYTPTSNEVGELVILTWETFDPDGNGPCTGAEDEAQLTISTPALAIGGGPYTICSSDIAEIAVTTSPGAGSWSGGDGVFGVSTSAATTYDPSDNEGATVVELIWTTVDPDNNGPCPVVTSSVEINVLAAAIAIANGPYAVCGAQPIELLATTNGSGIWSGGQGIFADSSDPLSTYTPDLQEVGTEVILVWSTFDPDDSGPCLGAEDETTLVITTPATAISQGPYTICSNGTAEIEVSTTPGQGSWQGGAGSFEDTSDPTTIYTPLSSEGGSNIILEWTTIDPDDSGPCPVVVAVVEVIILEEATATINGPYQVCTNEEVTIMVDANGPGEWSWTPVGQGTVVNANEESTQFIPSVIDLYNDYSVNVEWTTFDPDGSGPCTAFTTSDVIEINGLPTITLQANYAIDCGDIISAEVSGGSGGDYTYQWSPSIGLIDPLSISTPVNASGTYAISITDGNGCTDVAETNVLINALDEMAQADDVETCLYESVELVGTATLGLAPFTYVWTPTEDLVPANGQSANVTFTYNDPIDTDLTLTYILNITDDLGCSDNEYVEVLVHPLPVVSVGPDMSFCADGPIFDMVDFSPDLESGLSAIWSPSQSVDPSILSIGINTFTYEFTDLNSCVNSDELVVTIHEVPVANFLYPNSACENEMVAFTNQSTCTTCGQLNYYWIFGDDLVVSNSANPTYVFSDTGYVEITLLVESAFGCGDIITQTIHILALPETSFELSEDVGCGPIDITITNTTVGAEITYAWSIDSYGSSDASDLGVITFPAAPCDSIFYEIFLAAENICGVETYQDFVLVYSAPYPMFEMSSDTICSELPMAVYNYTECAWETTYSWDLGDGTLSDSQDLILENVYFAEGNFVEYNITLFATNQCGTIENTQVLTVVPNTIDAFFVANPVNGCEALPVTFDQAMNGVTYFAWDFGDGTSSLEEDPTHVFQNDGTYITTFLAGNFCGAQDTATQVITVLPAPEFDFISSEDFLCVGEATTFTAFGDEIYGYEWSYGDGNSSTADSPSYVYGASGEYIVTLTALSAENGCPSTVTNIIEVITTPIAEIIADTLAGCPPLMVTFSNNSTNAINYFWNIDDGTNYIGDTLQYSFENSGVYDVEVVAINSNSCTDTTSVEVTVYPSPEASFTFNAEDSELELDVSFINQSVNAIAYSWEFGDGGKSFSTHPHHSFQKDGECTYYPMLTAYNSFGCKDVAIESIDLSFLLKVYAPNSFTPNGDGLNDFFTVLTQDVDPETSHLRIIDRWGVSVYEYKGVNPAWDGFIDGQPALNDSYLWLYKARLKCGYEEFRHTGHVILVR